MLTETVVISVIGFVSGSLMFSYYIPKIFKKINVINIPGGDGNPGSSNAIRAAGYKMGFLCMGLDVCKAFVPVFIAVNILGVSNYYLVPVIIAPILGHAFSPLLGGNGGKAISTVYGSLLALFPLSSFVFIVALIMAFFKFIVVVRPDSSGVIVSMCAATAAALLFEPLIHMKLAVMIISIVVIYKIHKNPNQGAHSISVWKYSLTYNDNGLRFQKI